MQLWSQSIVFVNNRNRRRVTPMSTKTGNKIPFLTPIGTARYPHLNTPDTQYVGKNGQAKFKVDLILDAADIGIIETIREKLKEWHGNAKVTEPFKQDDTGEWFIKTWSYNQPVFVDSTGATIAPSKVPAIWGGSKIRIAGSIASNDGPVKGARLELKAVKLVEVVGPTNQLPDDFKTVEGSYIAEHDDVPEVTPDEETKKDPVTKAASF